MVAFGSLKMNLRALKENFVCSNKMKIGVVVIQMLKKMKQVSVT